MAASLLTEHRRCGTRAQLLPSMWSLPRSGIKLVSSTLAGKLFTTGPPGKTLPPFIYSIIYVSMDSCIFILYVDYNLVLRYLVAQILPALGAPPVWLLGPFAITPLFLSLSTSLVLSDAPGSSCLLPALTIQSAISPRSQDFLLSENGV